jgi:hypothetical protein
MVLNLIVGVVYQHVGEEHILTRNHKQFLVIAAVSAVHFALDQRIFLLIPYAHYLVEIPLLHPFWLLVVPGF